MNYYLLKIKTSGMKNLEKEIELNFYAQTKSKKIKPTKNNVKVIYGANGSGKSAIINSINFYKTIIRDKNYLLQDSTHTKLFKMLNKKNRKFAFESVFAICDDRLKVEDIYSHKIEVCFKDNKLQLTMEKLSRLNDTTINGNYETLFFVENGALQTEFLDDDSHLTKLILEKSKNLLANSSLSAFVTSMNEVHDFFKELEESDENSEEKFSTLVEYCVRLAMYANNILVYLDSTDKHRTNNPQDQIRYIEKMEAHEFKTDYIKFLSNNLSDADQTIPKEELSNHLEHVKNLEKFLRVFKPQLQKIDVISKIDGDVYHCSKIMQYKDYEVSSEYESTGIKKLIKLFNYLDAVSKGQIVFIDELDANLNGVVLDKLLRYFSEYAQGQLCFTSHNFEPMTFLKANKNSIDFLNDDAEIISWVKNGNYNPINQYKEGMIKGAPFNIESFDFISIFNTEDGDECS